MSGVDGILGRSKLLRLRTVAKKSLIQSANIGGNFKMKRRTGINKSYACLCLVGNRFTSLRPNYYEILWWHNHICIVARVPQLERLVWAREERKRLQRHHKLGLEIITSVARLVKDADASKWSNKDHNKRTFPSTKQKVGIWKDRLLCRLFYNQAYPV